MISQGFGSIKTEEKIYDEKFNEQGSVKIYERGFGLNYGDFSITAPYNYIVAIEKQGEAGLGKIYVKFVVYDMFSSKYDLEFQISDMMYHTLKRRWEETKDE